MSTDRTQLRKATNIYAQALLDAAKAEGRVFEVSGQLEQATRVIRGNMELQGALTDRTIAGADRAKIAKEVFADLDKSVVQVIGVVVERDDVAMLGRITEEYVSLAESELGAVFIDVTTVVSLDDKLRDSIKQKYSAQLGREILLREHVDASLVGGIVLSAHGSKVDASMLTQLDRARIALSSAS